jgi:hypothetical protein
MRPIVPQVCQCSLSGQPDREQVATAYLAGRASRGTNPREPDRWSPVTSSPTEWLQESSLGVASHCDDDFSLSVSLFQISDSLGDLTQRVRSVDDRCDCPGLEEPLQDGHLVLLARHREVREVRGRQLAHERRERHHFEDARDASEPAAGPCPKRSCPMSTYFPLGVRTRRQSENGWLPGMSKIRS